MLGLSMAGLAGLAGVSAQAAERAPTEEDYFAQVPVVLTASRLDQPLNEAPGAMTVIDRETIRQSGARTVAEVLRLVPGYVLGGWNGANPLASYHVALDDFGGRNLVLIDGRSVYASSYLGDTHYGMMGVLMQDIERIEVLRGANSAAYGANAMFGVVNIITRSGVEGAQAQLYHGQYDEGDGKITRADFVLGFNGDRGSLTTAVEYRKEEEVMARDRPYSAYPQGQWHPTRGWTTVSQWGVINLPASLGGNRVLDAGADWRDIGNFHALNTNTGST